jgi:hypothetical protein
MRYPGERIREKWRRRFAGRGYELRRVVVADGCGGEAEVTQAFSLAGVYIGEPGDAYHLCVRLGIKPEPRTRNSAVCTVGYSRRKRRWFGWSHRAIGRFLDRGAAARFAESVS